MAEFSLHPDPTLLDASAPALAENQGVSAMRIILVEWRIEKGAEDQFLAYWSQHLPIPDRSGLMGEFLSGIESREQHPWITWNLDERWTTFINVGLWRTGADFEDQIGRYIDDAGPLLPFEAERRRRVFVAPQRWRIGVTQLPVSESGQVH